MKKLGVIIILFLIVAGSSFGQGDAGCFVFQNINQVFEIEGYKMVQELNKTPDFYFFRLEDVDLSKIKKLSERDLRKFKRNSLFVEKLDSETAQQFESSKDYYYADLVLYVVGQITYSKELKSLVILEQRSEPSSSRVIIYHLVTLLNNKVTSTIKYQVTYIPHSPDDKETTERSYFIKNRCFEYIDDDDGKLGTYCIGEDGLVNIEN